MKIYKPDSKSDYFPFSDFFYYKTCMLSRIEKIIPSKLKESFDSQNSYVNPHIHSKAEFLVKINNSSSFSNSYQNFGGIYLKYLENVEKFEEFLMDVEENSNQNYIIGLFLRENLSFSKEKMAFKLNNQKIIGLDFVEDIKIEKFPQSSSNEMFLVALKIKKKLKQKSEKFIWKNEFLVCLCLDNKTKVLFEDIKKFKLLNKNKQDVKLDTEKSYEKSSVHEILDPYDLIKSERNHKNISKNYEENHFFQPAYSNYGLDITENNYLSIIKNDKSYENYLKKISNYLPNITNTNLFTSTSKISINPKNNDNFNNLDYDEEEDNKENNTSNINYICPIKNPNLQSKNKEFKKEIKQINFLHDENKNDSQSQVPEKIFIINDFDKKTQPFKEEIENNFNLDDERSKNLNESNFPVSNSANEKEQCQEIIENQEEKHYLDKKLIDLGDKNSQNKEGTLIKQNEDFYEVDQEKTERELKKINERENALNPSFNSINLIKEQKNNMIPLKNEEIDEKNIKQENCLNSKNSFSDLPKINKSKNDLKSIQNDVKKLESSSSNFFDSIKMSEKHKEVLEKHRMILIKGKEFWKFGRRNFFHPSKRTIFFDETLNQFFWGKGKKKKLFLLKDIIEIRHGRNTKNFVRFGISNKEKNLLSFSLILPNRSIDLMALDNKEKEEFIEALIQIMATKKFLSSNI